MSREVRKVPPGWTHPKYPANYHYPDRCGQYVPLLKYNFQEDYGEWLRGFTKWQAGFCDNGDPIPPEYENCRYSEYECPCPSPDDYMPEWPENEATHYIMYESVSEGTPISPAFATPEELAQWLVDNNACAFAPGDTATYEQWLGLIHGTSAPSMVVDNGVVISGIAWAAENR